MKAAQDVWMCTECGFASTSRFASDICPNCGMTYWHCKECGYTIVGAASPDVCPECKAKSVFLNIGCYIPGWREIEDINSHLLGNLIF
jgi:rubrerythrin